LTAVDADWLEVGRLISTCRLREALYAYGLRCCEHRTRQRSSKCAGRWRRRCDARSSQR
jgi:hypothetical protein